MVSRKENPLINLLANVVLPVVILNKLSAKSPLFALLFALSLPLAYGIWSYLREGKLNYISVLGGLNTLFTGGFALLQLEGFWFAVKEAAFPLLIGIFVMFSAYSTRPFLKMMLWDTGALNTEEIDAKLIENNATSGFQELLKKATFYFSLTFYFSAFLNFVLAIRIFTKIPEALPELERAEILNGQIAEMTWMGYVVIFVPSIILFFAIMYYFFRNLTKLTGLKLEELVKS